MVGPFGWLGILVNFNYGSQTLCWAVEIAILGAKSFERLNWMKAPEGTSLHGSTMYWKFVGVLHVFIPMQ